MSKKILSVVLALVLVMTTFAVSAFAVGDYGYEEDNTKTQTWALENKRDNGDGTWSVDVRLTANYVVGAISFQVTSPDSDALVGATLESVTKGSALTFDANIQRNKTSGLVVVIPVPSSDDEKGVDLTAGGVIATLTFQLTADSADVVIKNDPKSETNKGGDLIAVRLSDENLTTGTWIYGQAATVGEKVTLGSAQVADPELVAKEGSTGYVDADRMYVYGVPAGTDAANFGNYFEATNDGYFEMSVGAATVTNGTGATLTLYNKAGEVVTTYTLVIFGDVDSNGTADANDATRLAKHVYSVNPLTSDATLFAADVQVEDETVVAVNANDLTALLKHSYSVLLISDNPRNI